MGEQIRHSKIKHEREREREIKKEERKWTGIQYEKVLGN